MCSWAGVFLGYRLILHWPGNSFNIPSFLKQGAKGKREYFEWKGRGGRSFAAQKIKVGQFCDFCAFQEYPKINACTQKLFICPKIRVTAADFPSTAPMLGATPFYNWTAHHLSASVLSSSHSYKSTFQDVNHWITVCTITKLWKSKQKFEKKKTTWWTWGKTVMFGWLDSISQALFRFTNQSGCSLTYSVHQGPLGVLSNQPVTAKTISVR